MIKYLSLNLLFMISTFAAYCITGGDGERAQFSTELLKGKRNFIMFSDSTVLFTGTNRIKLSSSNAQLIVKDSVKYSVNQVPLAYSNGVIYYSGDYPIFLSSEYIGSITKLKGNFQDVNAGSNGGLKSTNYVLLVKDFDFKNSKKYNSENVLKMVSNDAEIKNEMAGAAKNNSKWKLALLVSLAGFLLGLAGLIIALATLSALGTTFFIALGMFILGVLLLFPVGGALRKKVNTKLNLDTVIKKYNQIHS